MFVNPLNLKYVFAGGRLVGGYGYPSLGPGNP